MKNQISNKDNIPPLFVVFFILILPSPILFHLGLKVRWGSVLLICFYCAYVLLIRKHTHKVKYLLFVIFSTMGLGTVTSFHYLSINYIFILSALIGYIFFYCLLNERDIKKFVDVGSKLLLILEIGAIIGFIYALIGQKPLLIIRNPDTRENYLYLSTFSNAVLGKFIRPSGIYDEPGAFSFFICAICALRIHYKQNPLMTLVMLLMGFITVSLTHFLCFIVFCIPIYKQLNKKQRKIAFVILSILIVFVFTIFYDFLNRFLFNRLQFDSTKGTFKGNSRNGQISGCIKSIKDNGLLFGNYLLGSKEILRRYGVIGENPLSCIALNGLFNSILYYIFIISCFIAFCLSLKIDYLILFILFLQRPYQSQLGYSFFFIHYLYLSFQEIKMFLTNNKRCFSLLNKVGIKNAR